MAEILFGIDFGACNLKFVRVSKKKIFPVKLNVNESGLSLAP